MSSKGDLVSCEVHSIQYRSQQRAKYPPRSVVEKAQTVGEMSKGQDL